MTLETLMRDFVKTIIHDEVIIVRDWDWYCEPIGKICYIHYDMEDVDGNDVDFRRACQSVTTKPLPYMEITLSLAHEAGHWLTREKYNTPEQLRMYKQQVNDCTYEEYFYLPAEIDATRAGVEWIITHPQEVEKFEKSCQNLLTK